MYKNLTRGKYSMILSFCVQHLGCCMSGSDVWKKAAGGAQSELQTEWAQIRDTERPRYRLTNVMYM